MKKIVILTVLITLMISCTQDSNFYKPSSSKSDASIGSTISANIRVEDEIEIPPPKTQVQKKNVPEPNKDKGSKIIKNGNMDIEVDNITTAKSFIDSILSINNGYYENEIFKNSTYRQNYTLKLRIPSLNFNVVVSSLEDGGGRILEKNINAKDVTEEYLDLEIRLENNRAYLKRYKELLAKAITIKEMIAIQEKVRHIEMLIDGNIGRLKFLTDKVEYSTLSIELTQTPEEILAEVPPSYFDEIIGGVKRGFSGVLYFVLILVNLWPILLGIILIIMYRKRMFDFLRKKRNVTST